VPRRTARHLAILTLDRAIADWADDTEEDEGTD